jgi:hypothetical protein
MFCCIVPVARGEDVLLNMQIIVRGVHCICCIYQRNGHGLYHVCTVQYVLGRLLLHSGSIQKCVNASYYGATDRKSYIHPICTLSAVGIWGRGIVLWKINSLLKWLNMRVELPEVGMRNFVLSP